jgi:DNA-directed RNA polymerase subunit RPC12/RpoP
MLNRLGLWASRRAGRCPRCGYDTNGLAPDAPCPECGTPIIAPNSKPAPASHMPERTVRHAPDA